MDKNAQLSLEQLKQQIKAVDPTIEEEDPGLKYSVVLLASVVLGTNPETLAKVTGHSVEFINQIASRLEGADIWKGNHVDYSDWFQKGSPGLGLDVLIAMGEIERWKIGSDTWRYGKRGESYELETRS